MSTPAVNITLRLDQSKLGDDAKKAESTLKSAINPTVDVFNVAEKGLKAVANAIGVVWDGLSEVASKTGGFQSLSTAIEGAEGALGKAADRSGALRAALGEAEKLTKSFTAYLNSEEGRGAVNKFFSFIVTGVADAIDAMNGMYKASVDVITEIDRFITTRIKKEAFSESLDPADKYGAASSTAENFANSLRSAANKGVEKSGTFVDPKVAADAKKQREDFDKQVEAALGRSKGAQQKLQLDSLKAQEEQAQREALIERNKTEILTTNEERREEIRREYAERRLKAHVAEVEAQARQGEELRQVVGVGLDSLASVAGAGAQALTAGIQAAFDGADFGAAVAGALGPAIAAIGASTFLMGLAALAQATISTFFPVLGAALGIAPGAGFGAAATAMATGTLLMGGGALITSLAKGGFAPSAGGGRASGGGGGGAAPASPSPAPARTPQGFQPGASSAAQPIVIANHYNFNGAMGGSPRRIARAINDATDAGESSRVAGRGRGGRRR